MHIGPDGGEPAGGLVLQFVADPALPGSVPADDRDVYLGEVAIELRNLRLIGDASAGGEQTMRSSLELHWAEEVSPAPEQFPQAPPGLYSTLRAQLDHYRLRGTVGGTEGQAFELVDEPAENLALEIQLGALQVTAGQTLTLAIVLEAADLMRGVPWDQLESEGSGPLLLPADGESRSGLRAAMVDAFYLEDDPPAEEAGSREDPAVPEAGTELLPPGESDTP